MWGNPSAAEPRIMGIPWSMLPGIKMARFQPLTPSTKYDKVFQAVWDTIIAACDAHARGETIFLGERGAPEFTDEQVRQQVESWDGYRSDSGALHWQENGSKTFAYDFTALPAGWQRALCERAWVMFRDAGMWEDKEYMTDVRQRRGDAIS